MKLKYISVWLLNNTDDSGIIFPNDVISQF